MSRSSLHLVEELYFRAIFAKNGAFLMAIECKALILEQATVSDTVALERGSVAYIVDSALIRMNSFVMQNNKVGPYNAYFKI